MSGISPISAGSHLAGHLPLSAAKAAQNSGLGASSASGDTTTTTSNADGSMTSTTVNAQGQIVSSVTTQPSNQAVVASNMATTADADILLGQMPSSLLNMVV
jgi:hypothetical protein